MAFASISLRLKFLIVLATMLTTVMVITIYILYRLMLPGILHEEHQSMVSQAWGIHQHINREISTLTTLADHWSRRPETLDFLEGSTGPQVPGRAFNTDQADIMILTDLYGDVMLAAGRNPFSGEHNICADTAGACQWMRDRLQSFTGDGTDGQTFLAPTAAGPGYMPGVGFFMLSNRLVQAPDTRQALGRLTLIRFLPRQWELTASNRSLPTLELDEVPRDFFNPKGGRVEVTLVDENAVRVRLLRESIEPERTIVMTTTLSREHFHQAMANFRLTMLGIVALLLLVMLATISVFQVTVLSPITQLSRYARRLRQTTDDRLETPPEWLKARTDELGLMAREFHNLINDLNKRNTYLKRISQRDALTGLGNRRMLDRQLGRTLALTHRLERPVALITIDVDHFKLYNDRYGHPEGDECLKAIADTLRDIFQRDSDLVTRTGGEEFVVLLPDFDHEKAMAIASGVCTAIRAQRIPHERSPTHEFVTVSAGVAVSLPESPLSASELIKQSDEALYRIKQGGRNAAGGASPAVDNREEVDTLFEQHRGEDEDE